ncbi:MAG TPA: YigZ family protein [Holophagaceae bacterium]|jgi:putative IMPACT (imprinted ancient) family translation regulator|nr:YigZ family protein [Holophagaceae bacterium]
MKRLAAPASFKLREKASVFLAELHPAPDAAARAETLAKLRKRDFDATHHCSAWREGLPVKSWGGDDDGEPSGTAGAPMLRVLEGGELTDLLAVCIRWYGGTKLGTGGLVRAYTEAVQGALAEAERHGLIETVRAMRAGRLDAPPAQAHVSFAFLSGVAEAEILGQGFDGTVAWVRFQIPLGLEPAVEAAWRERSRGGAVSWEA